MLVQAIKILFIVGFGDVTNSRGDIWVFKLLNPQDFGAFLFW